MVGPHSMITQQRVPQQGEIVTVRQRRYLVDEVIPPITLSDSTLVKLSCVDDDAQGQQLSVFWELELDGEFLLDAWNSIGEKGFDRTRMRRDDQSQTTLAGVLVECCPTKTFLALMDGDADGTQAFTMATDLARITITIV